MVLRNFKKLKKAIILTPFFLFIIYIIVINIPDFADRFNNTLTFIQTGNINQIDNLTVFSIASNFQVAIHNFITTFGFGIGLGGHETTYYRYFESLGSNLWMNGINASSAHSLTIRIISEIGAMGIIIFIVLLIQVLKIKDSAIKAVALASFSHFLAKSIKLGGYFDYGTMFFLATIIIAIRIDRGKENNPILTIEE